MTDKQIIIDGVDVSRCEFATKAEMVCDTHCRLYDYEYCIGKDCHYKNWQRKEQECETLASQLDFEVQKKECLEQECERLKNIINVAKNSKLDLKSFLVGEAIQKEYEQQLDQLKQVIKKVREACDVPLCGDDTRSLILEICDEVKDV